MSPPPGYSEGELAIPPFKPRSSVDDGSTSPHPARRPPPPPSRPSASKLPARIDHKPESRLGQYRIIKTVGEGSFGKVKLAIHEVTGQKVALKMISRKNLTSRDMAGRVEREIAYLQLLRHPHIIKLWVLFPGVHMHQLTAQVYGHHNAAGDYHGHRVRGRRAIRLPG
jgi:hypothetical protein